MSEPQSTSSSFRRYIGIDYSGAKTPTSSLPGLRLFCATRDDLPVEIPPPPSRRKYWTRRGVAEWLFEQLSEDARTIVGIDHGFSFPLTYFERHGVARDWSSFLDDFCAHWPTDQDDVYVDFVRNGILGDAQSRLGETRWRRLTEIRARAAKSVFHFDVQGSVAKSTHAGLPWLRFLREGLGERVHFWPFDGWACPADRHVVAEVYPALWNRAFPSEGRTSDQHDAYCIARWMRERDRDDDGSLRTYLRPSLTPEETEPARLEGWILGVE